MLASVGLAAGLAGCAEEPLPRLPDGAELVLQVGELEVYKVFDGPVCAGTLRRIELHTLGLADLFSMDPPRARVLLFPDSEAIMEACHGPAWGCAGLRGAQAMPSTVTHELAHVFVNNATDDVRPRPGIREGLAWALEGHLVGPPWPPQPDLQDLEAALITPHHPLDVPRDLARHVFAWAIDRHGLDVVLEAYVDTSAVETDEVLPLLAETLGYASPDDLHADYASTYAWYYPRVPDTTRVFTSDELEHGARMDLSCAGPYTEGPSAWRQYHPHRVTREGELHIETRLEFLREGLYELESEGVPFEEFSLRWQPTGPLFDDAHRAGSQPNTCSTNPLQIYVWYPGEYQLLTRQPREADLQTTVSVRFVAPYSEDVCAAWE